MNLTAEQLEAVRQGQPLRFTDPETKGEFVVLRADLFERVKALISGADDDPEAMYPLLADMAPEDWEDSRTFIAFAEAAGEEWDDPALDVYEQYRKKP